MKIAVSPSNGWIWPSSPAALSTSALVYGVGSVEWMQPLWTYFGSNTWLGDRGAGAYLIQGLVPTLLILPSTLLMGMSFAFLQRAVQTDVRVLGRRVGWFQAANIAGSLAGALLTGVLLLNYLGSPGTLRLLAAASLIFIVLFARNEGHWRAAVAPTLIAAPSIQV